jgi:DNA ligase (NAD+)
MTDYEWDNLYDELKKLEQETNIIYPNSPTQNIGYKVLDNIKKIKHNHLMLSLDKCHSEQELIEFANNKKCVLSVKADGLSLSLHYLDGNLIGAETRGDGVVGSDVLQNVLNIKNVPHTIPYKDELVVDGEVIIDWNTFNKINENLPLNQDKYKHPRNLVSGTITMLDTKIASNRNMRFIAWRVIKGLDKNIINSVFFSLKELEKFGFEIIPMWTYSNNSHDKENLSKMLVDLQNKADELGIPYDGAVMTYDDVCYGNLLGRTEKFFKHSISYKYEDELYETELQNIEWQTSKTGLINPVAKFKKTLIDGSGVSKATLHNISYIEKLQLGIGDKIRIYKANKIIPKVYDNITRSNTFIIPSKCPICDCETEIQQDNDSKVLFCTNPNCKGKLLGKLTHFVSKNAINIEGLSEQTLQNFIDLGWLNSFIDIYNLSGHKQEMYKLDGFGKKSVDKLINSIEKSRNITLDRFIYALSIPKIGKSNAKLMADKFGSYDFFQKWVYYFTDNDMSDLELMNYGYSIDWTHVKGFDIKTHETITRFILENADKVYSLLNEFTFKNNKNENSNSNLLKDKRFVVTGSLTHYKNRDELVEVVKSLGGKVSGSISSKTSYLINNDTKSNSSKNKKAKELNIPIISEEDFISMIS